jgi:hypothetical protein
MWASEALHLQLQQAARTHKLEDLVLADSLGNTWAASGGNPAPSKLVGDLARRGLLHGEGDLGEARLGNTPVLIQKVQVGSATLYLAAKGAQRRGKPALKRAARGVVRILSSLI